MNNQLFQQARAAYASKDYEGALQAYTDCLQDEAALQPGDAGLLYHQIGNCLIKLRNHTEAIQAYSQATADDAYDAIGTVNYNLGMAYASLHDYDNAVKHFDAAVADETYDTPYKAYSAMGSALMKVGKSAEAGVAFREAALDEANPDPTKALLNLGVCFMALDRPADAVASYESALQFPMTADVKNKLYANLGQAYVACGQMQMAVQAFEEAIADQTYFLSDSASVDYQRAVGAVAQGTMSIEPIAGPGADTSGLDVVSDETAVLEQDDYGFDPDQYYYTDDPADAEAVDMSDSQELFFTATDTDIEQWSEDMANQGRKKKRTGLKVLIAIIIVVILLLGGAVFAYSQGYGFPMQEQVAEDLFADPQAATTTLFAEGIDEQAAANLVAPVVQDPAVAINAVERSMATSAVYTTATTAEGGAVQYKVSMVRDLIGWKISDIDLYFASQN